MINIKPKIHDLHTLEFKVGYVASPGKEFSKFEMNTWIYIPETLDVNRHTYAKETFYSDMRCYVRLITPYYRLKEIASVEVLPYVRLKDSQEKYADNPSAVNQRNLEREIKMYASIAKSSIRDASAELRSAFSAEKLKVFCSLVASLLQNYRAVLTVDFQPLLYGDEFISNVVEQHGYRLLSVSGTDGEPLRELLAAEDNYRRERGYHRVEVNSADRNSGFLYHAGQLKKYIESNLYLPTHKRRNAVFLEQVVFSLAAGLSMVFATVISFAFQQTYGNFTLPFFCALVISYMFKDRIKELVRMYFANRMGSRLFDYKIKIQLGNRLVGTYKEGFDFVVPEKVPSAAQKVRNRHSPLVLGKGVDEQVIQYRKRMHLNRKVFSRLSAYPLQGVNDIMRINLSEFMRKMDNARIPLVAPTGNGQFQPVDGEKDYFLNFVMQLKYESEVYYRRYRVCLNRKGIKKIETK